MLAFAFVIRLNLAVVSKSSSVADTQRTNAEVSSSVSAFASMVRWMHMSADEFISGPSSQMEDRQPDLVASLAPLLRARSDLEPEDVEHLENLIRAAVRRSQAKRSQAGR